MTSFLNGIININKPSGISSFDVIRKLKYTFKFRDKTGFLGTLDPMATGVLPVFVGKATKLIPYMKNEPKIYRVNIMFGISTDSFDAIGEKVKSLEPQDVAIDEDELKKHIKDFIGEIEQRPPIVSAIKINGKRAYKYFREGKEVEIPIRKKKIFNIDLINFSRSGDYPCAEILVSCESGTYMRSLAVDIGARLDLPSHVARLCRISSGDFHIDDSISLDKVLQKDLKEQLLSPDSFLDFEDIFISEESDSYARLLNGNEMKNLWQVESGLYKIKNRKKRLLAIYRAEGNVLKVERMLL